MLDLEIDSKSSTPLYLQLKHQLQDAIDSGKFQPRSVLPSMKELQDQIPVSKVTINRAYQQLVKEGCVERLEGKGFFVLARQSLKVLLIFNKLNSFKKIIYYSLIKTLGGAYTVDLRIHHYNPDIFKDIIAECKGKYDYYVVMPHFYADVDPREFLNVLAKIPPKKLVLIDRNIPELKGVFISVYQDFKADIHNALKRHKTLFKKYNSMVFVDELNSISTIEIHEGAASFCRDLNLNFKTLANLDEHLLRKGEVYLIMTENELAEALKKAKALSLKPGRDIGIISFNENALKEVLNVCVLTTDWEKMGATAGRMIKDKNQQQVKNEFVFIKRGSL